MTDFRDAQNQAHPNKRNTLISSILFILIGILSIQVWLLYIGLNNALEEHFDIAVATFIGSLMFFLIGLWVLRFLPGVEVKKTSVQDIEKEDKYG